MFVALVTSSLVLVQPEFSRSTDLLAARQKVSARQVVNVLGRWKTRRDWNEGIGRKGLLDDYRSGDYYDEDVPKLSTDFSKPMREYIARRPQFLDFCERYGLVARWVHRENVGSLPFPDDEAGRALAASVGATVAELNAEAVDEYAADVVFDALSFTGRIGFVDETICDERRASFLDADGAFDAQTFGQSLQRSRRNLAAVLLAGPGSATAVLLAGFYAFLPQLLEAGAQVQARVESNVGSYGAAAFLPPLALGVVLLAARLGDDTQQAQQPPAEEGGRALGRALNYQERAVLQRDELYRERMRRKRSGELEEADATPEMSDALVKSYYEKMWSGRSGIGFKARQREVAPPRERRDDIISSAEALRIAARLVGKKLLGEGRGGRESS